MTTVTATNLRRIIDQVRAHQATDDTLPPLRGIHLDATPGHLHAVATDRYTFAVARAEAHHARDPWAHTLPGAAVPVLRGWLDTLQGGDLVQINPEVDGTTHLLFEALSGTLAFDVVTEGVFPDWRHHFAKHLGKESRGEYTAFTAQMLGRWHTGPELLHAWQTGPRSPLILSADNFLGMQMPVFYNDMAQEIADVRAAWRGTLRRRSATVYGVVYPLDVPWSDRTGDVWEYRGDDSPAGDPMMRLAGLAEDAGAIPLTDVISAFGPLTHAVVVEDHDDATEPEPAHA